MANKPHLTPSETQQVRKWLSQGEANLFRKMLSAQVAVIQQDAADLLLEGVMHRDQSVEAARIKMEEAVLLVHTLDVLEGFVKEPEANL